MRQLPRNQFKKVYWIIVCFIILGISFFPSCAAKKDQSINNADIKPLQEETVDSEVTKEPINKGKIVTAIEVAHTSDAVNILIKGNMELKYTSIKQSFPFGIAIYLPDTILDEAITSIVPETGDISNVIPSYADKDKKTAKIEILLNKDLPYNIEKKAKTLNVIIATDNKIEAPADKQTDALTKDTKTLKIPKGIATLSDIEFNVEDEGYTELTLTTSHPIKYSFSKGSKGILYLNLYKTDIPRRHKRPFETKYFKSAVSRILPMQKSKNSKIEISMRERVPYHVVQGNNKITVRFEPSSIEPPKFTKAEKIAAQRAADGKDSEVTSTELIPQQTFDRPKTDNFKKNEASKPASAAKSSPKITQATKPVMTKLTPEEIAYKAMIGETEYTGEKIKLDFYETDIKNVFRILSGISSKNFAIDKNVTGNVTLTLDKPIPWDQVLDLILAMNQLGKTETGDVIRIATQATLSQETKQKHAKFETLQKAKKAQEALQPVITEYIPINYANASSDIMPHIKKILTPKRGTVSVDQRTNMIIITDTKEVVEKTKHLIYTLDNVTPQIMISAKIIEANKDFSRSLGLGTSLGWNEGVTTPVDDDYTVSLNAPASSPQQAISLTFNNLMSGMVGGRGNAFLSTTLSAAESKGDIEVLSSPKILTLDNMKATIKQGLEYPYNKLDEAGNTTTEYKNIDLLLEVTPHVTPDKRISMAILLTKNEIAGFRGDVPSLSTNETKTTLLVNNNDTIVIGGVLKSKKTTDKSGFPFLMNIPLLGRLFRTDLNTEDKQELLIFITPTIVQLKQRRNEINTSDQTIE